MGICYRPLNQNEEKDEAFYEQLVEAVQSQHSFSCSKLDVKMTLPPGS